MQPVYVDGNVRAHCPNCKGAVTTFEGRSAQTEYGMIIVNKGETHEGVGYQRVLYRLFRCAGCGRGGFARILDNAQVMYNAALTEFFFVSIDRAALPKDVPDGIVKEFQEAELCAAHGAWRAASALLRPPWKRHSRPTA